MTSTNSIRTWSRLPPRRYTLTSDRLVGETLDSPGSWSPEFVAPIEAIVALYRYRKWVLWPLLWLIATAPAAFVGLIVALVGQEERSNAAVVVGGVVVGGALLLSGLSLLTGLRRRWFLRVQLQDGRRLDIRMDRPMFQGARRRAFFSALFRALSLRPPSDL